MRKDKTPTTVQLPENEPNSDSFFSTEQENLEGLLYDFEKYLHKEGKRLSTVNGNKNMVRNYFGWLQKEGLSYLEVSYSDLLEYIRFMRTQTPRIQTANQKILAVRHFYSYLLEIKAVKMNPCVELHIKGAIRKVVHDLLNLEELEELYKNYPTTTLITKRNKVIFGLMIYQGVMGGEITAFEVKDVDLESATIYIPGVSRSNSRTLKLHSLQLLPLQYYITQIRPVLLTITGKESDKLFLSTGDSKNLRNSQFRVMFDLKKLNPKIKTPEQIRASVITHWLKNNNIRQVQYMSGHRYVSSTEHYRTDTLEGLQDLIDELHPLK